MLINIIRSIRNNVIACLEVGSGSGMGWECQLRANDSRKALRIKVRQRIESLLHQKEPKTITLFWRKKRGPRKSSMG